MDVVYPFKSNGVDNKELLYSFRSLKNIPHKDVVIIGEMPEWIIKWNVRFIHHDDHKLSKYLNVIDKYRVICDDESISEEFILMNDDIYILNPIDDIPYYSKGTMEEHLSYIYRKHWKSSYYEILKRVSDKYPDGYSYNTHTPIIYNKKKLKKILDMIWDSKVSIKSMYGNYYWLKPVLFRKKYWTDDCKLYNSNISKELNIENQDFMSSCDHIIWPVENYLKEKFKDKSIYEI